MLPLYISLTNALLLRSPLPIELDTPQVLYHLYHLATCPCRCEPHLATKALEAPREVTKGEWKQLLSDHQYQVPITSSHHGLALTAFGLGLVLALVLVLALALALVLVLVLALVLALHSPAGGQGGGDGEGLDWQV